MMATRLAAFGTLDAKVSSVSRQGVKPVTKTSGNTRFFDAEEEHFRHLYTNASREGTMSLLMSMLMIRRQQSRDHIATPECDQALADIVLLMDLVNIDATAMLMTPTIRKKPVKHPPGPPTHIQP